MNNPQISAGMCGLGLILAGCSEEGPRDPFFVVDNGSLAPNIALGIDSSRHEYDWVQRDNDRDELVADYASGQEWGLLQFLLGLDIPEERPVEDFSRFRSVELVLDGEWAAATTSLAVELGGVADVAPDGIAYAPRSIALPDHAAGAGLVVYQIALAAFDRPGQPAPLERLYAPVKLVFTGRERATARISEIALFEAEPACGAGLCVSRAEKP